MSHVYITEDGAKVFKKGGRFLVSRNTEVLFEIPEETLESLVLIGRVNMSPAVTEHLLYKGIPVTWLSKTGRFFGRLESTNHCNAIKQAKQVLLQGTETALRLGRVIIEAKIHNQQVLLRRYNREVGSKEVQEAAEQLSRLKKKASEAPDRYTLMGNEGLAARIYFRVLSRLVPQYFLFFGRTKQPPLDPFNAIISFGYTLLFYEVYTALTNAGLHPYFGFLHALKQHHPALASDLMEEWRPALIDSLAMSLVNHHQLLPEHFEREEAAVYLNREGRFIFLTAYEKRLRSTNKYLDREQSFRQSIVFQAESFSRVLMEDNMELYTPVRLR